MSTVSVDNPITRLAVALSKALSAEVFLAALVWPASILLNRALGPEERGIWAALLVVPSTVFTLCVCQWDRVAKSAVSSKTLTPGQTWGATQILCWKLGCFAIPTTILFSYFLASAPWEWRWVGALYSLIWPFFFLGGCAGSIALAAGRMRIYYLNKVAHQLSYGFLLYVFYFLNRLNIPILLLIYALIHIAGWLAVVPFMPKSEPQNFPEARVRSLIKINFGPYALETVAAQGHIWALAYLASKAELGAFVAMLALFTPLQMFSNALLNAATARLDWSNREQTRHYLSLSTATFAGVALVSFGILCFIAKPLILFVFGVKYVGEAWLAPWLALMVATQAGAQHLHISLQLSGRMDDFIRVQTAEAIIRLTLLGTFAITLGLRGVIIASLLASISRALWSILLLRKD